MQTLFIIAFLSFVVGVFVYDIIYNSKKNASEEKEQQEPKEIASNMFDSWLNELEEKEQPESCSIDNPDCENCGS